MQCINFDEHFPKNVLNMYNKLYNYFYENEKGVFYMYDWVEHFYYKMKML